MGDARPSAGAQAHLYNDSNYQSSSAHLLLVHASHHFQSLLPCAAAVPLSCLSGVHKAIIPAQIPDQRKPFPYSSPPLLMFHI